MSRLELASIYQSILNSQNIHLPNMFISGSVATGFSDNYSDLELVVIWDELPSLKTRKEIINSCNWVDYRFFNFESHVQDEVYHDNIENKTASGIQIEIMHFTKNYISERIEKLSKQPSVLTDEDYKLFDGITRSKSIEPDFYIEELKNNISYSDEIQTIELQRNLQFSHIWKIEAYLIRKDMLVFLEKTFNELKKIARCLYALNSRFFHGIKWFRNNLSSFEFSPTSLNQLLLALDEGEYVNVYSKMIQVIEEIYAFIEVNSTNSFDIQKLKEILYYKRTGFQ